MSASALPQTGEISEAIATRTRSINFRLVRLLTLLYGALITYGSLYPFSGWSLPHDPMFSFVTASIPDHNSGADLLTNVLAYIPLGILLVWGSRFRSALASIVIAIGTGGLLSFSMEAVQMFLPSRTSSNVDLLMNVAGSVIGALLGHMIVRNSFLTLQLRELRSSWFEPQEGVNVALCALSLWILSQLSPFVLSMDISSTWHGISPLLNGLQDLSSLSVVKIATYALNIAGLGLLIAIAARPGRNTILPFLSCAAIVFCIKPAIATRQLALDAVCGLGLAAILLALIPAAKAIRALLAISSIFGSFMLSEVCAGSGRALHGFNWTPFAGQLDNTVAGFASILETAWPFVALASLTILGFGRKRGPMMYIGGVLILLVFGLEWAQTGIEGRYGDITTVLIAAAAWYLPWLYSFLSGLALHERDVRRPNNLSAHTP